MLRSLTRHHSSCRMGARRGVSLIEASVVLGVAGSIIGGLWMVMASVRENSRATTLVQQTILTVKGVRDYYAGLALPTGVAGETTAATYTATLRAASVFPEDMCPANCVSGTVTNIYNVYGGTTLVNIVNSSPYTNFNIAHSSLSLRCCMQAIMNLGAKSAEMGLVSVTVNSGTTYSAFPVDPDTVKSVCTPVDPATTVTLNLVFKVRG